MGALLADAFPTGYHATELARVSPGDSVAIFGAGAVGFQAHDWNDPGHENPAVVIHALAQIINPTGRLGIVGVFLPHDARRNGDLEARGDLAVPWPQLFAKGIEIGMGRDHDERYNAHLRDLIIACRSPPLRPLFVRSIGARTATSRSCSTRPHGHDGGAARGQPRPGDRDAITALS